MAQTFKGAINLPSNFDVQTTSPLDVRLVVDSVESLTDGSIKYPYKGMVVNIAGTSELWILKTQGIENSHNIDNWGKVSGDINSEDLNEVKESIKKVEESDTKQDEKISDLEEGLSTVSDLVGNPDESDLSGLFKEVDDLKKGSVSTTLKYTIPMMTPAMAEAATNDESIEFDEDSDPYILTDYDGSSLDGEVTNNTITSVNGTYLDVMMRAIRSLQAEVARLKNSFTYGIDSYTDTKTAKSVLLGEYDDVTTEEPLWAIDPGYLSEVEDSSVFNTYLGKNHSFTKYGSGTIDISDSEEGQLTFNNCRGEFSDGDENGENLTLYKLEDSKLITYLVTTSSAIKMTLVSMDDSTKTREVDLSVPMNGNSVNKYGYCIVISRKVKDSTTNTEKGFNYVYMSIINYENDSKLYEGYLKSDGTLSDTRVDLDYRYSIKSLLFENLTLTRMKFYTKYEDFSEEVISSAPSESDYKYEVAHIAIRSVKSTTILNEIKDQLHDNELIWNQGSKTLHIKSNGNLYLIGSNTNAEDIDDSDYNNNNDNMTDKEILTALKKMGIVVNVNYKKDSSGNDTDEIESLDDLSLAPISDFTFVNGDTGKEFTFTVDTEGNLVGKDISAETVEELMTKLKNKAADYDADEYVAVRGFSSDYLFRKSNENNDGYSFTLADGVNLSGDAGKNSDRLRISSFYAPISTDTVHGCSHSFIELENSSNLDIPLTGVYLHFYNPEVDKVYHLALDGVIKAGGTYLVRGAKHAELDDKSTFIKVSTFDKEWYYNGELVSFEQAPVTYSTDGTTIADDSKVKIAYRFCLTYGLSDLSSTEKLCMLNSTSNTSKEEYLTKFAETYNSTDFPNLILNPRFIDSCSFSTDASVSKNISNNPWYINGSSGSGITIKSNTMFRLTFALDPAKQAFNGFNGKDGSRVRYNKAQDLQILNLSKEFIGYPFSDDIIKIDKFTPKASFENRNIMTDKTQIDTDKPNMVTCSFGVDVYNTRCFNWISCGAFDEYVWIRKSGDTTWTKFQSYTTVSSDNTEGTTTPRRKEYSKIVNNAAYARIIDRFPGNDVLFTSHKCVIVLPDASTTPVTYEYVVGRPDKDGKPDSEHTNDIYTFTVYPRTFEGRTYQVTDQQGFHWIEYQVWAAAANYLNTKIESELYTSKTVKLDVTGENFDITLPDDCKEVISKTYSTDLSNVKYIDGKFYEIVSESTSGSTSIEGYGDVNITTTINPSTVLSYNEISLTCTVEYTAYKGIFPILLNTGDMTQSGARINEWLDYYNAGRNLFKHLEQMNCVGNNDLCPTSPNDLGTGNDTDKSNSRFFHYFYCFDVKDSDVSVSDDELKYFNGESLVVPAHTCNVTSTEIPDRYIPSFYYFKTKGVLYIMVNSEIPEGGCQGWYGLCSSNKKYVNIYTGIESIKNGIYDKETCNFTPLYETMYAWLNENKNNDNRKIVVAMHEMPFTVITNTSLSNSVSSYIPATRNFPLGTKSRVGSNVNQLNLNENRGTYWCSRLLEYFGCKIVIGGHKHTYALSYPIKERYTWTYDGVTTDSKDAIKPMHSTLEEESGTSPEYEISWDILITDSVKSEFYIDSSVLVDEDKNPVTLNLNSTKTPYIPKVLYSEYGESVSKAQSTTRYRCCSPISVSDDKYDGFITYSMCQATGYKLKSNKELPSQAQVFSKIIPQTTHKASGDTPNGNQLYPMYSVLKFNSDYSELEIDMVRIHGIMASDSTDTFNQSSYGKKSMSNQYLCTFEKEDCNYIVDTYQNTDTDDTTKTDLITLTDVEVGELGYCKDTNKVYIYTKNSSKDSSGNTIDTFTWDEYTVRMYGNWLSEKDAETRYNNYLADTTNVSDNRYVHIKF